MKTSAILLAAGRSQRMGAFKPLLPFGKSTVLRNCIAYLQSGGIIDIVVVVGHRAREVQHSLRDLPVRFAFNRNQKSKMNASIASGIEALSGASGPVIIALGDHPAVSAAVVTTLITQWNAGDRLVIPEFEGHGGHPVLVDLSFREELLGLDPAGGLKSFFETHKLQVRRVPVDSPYIARDIDTWDDYVALHEEIFGLTPKP